MRLAVSIGVALLASTSCQAEILALKCSFSNLEPVYFTRYTDGAPARVGIGPGIGSKAAFFEDRFGAQIFVETNIDGRSISYEFVASYLRDVFRRYDIRKLAFDRWNFKHLLPWLLKAGMSEQFVKDHFVEFGQGMQSMSPALRDLEQVLLEGELAHGNHPVLTMCVTNTVIAVDDAGNRKPSKRKSTGRIDGMIALAMAVGVAPLLTKQIDISTLIV